MRPREIGGLVVLAALWGASFLFIRIAAPALGPLPLMAGRVLLAAAVLALVAAARRTRVSLRPFAGRLLVLGLIHAAAPFALIAAAEIRLTASMAAVLLAVQPMFTALVGAPFGERLTARRIAGFALGVAGVAALVGWTPTGLDRSALVASAAVLLAALLYAAGTVYSRRRLADAPIATLALGQQLAAAVWLIVPASFALPSARFEGRAVAAMVALAVLSTALAYQIFFWLIASAGPVKASMVTYLVPLFGVLWGVVLLGEPMGIGMALGLAAILTSLLLVGRNAGPRRDARGFVATAPRPAD
jgi:drug/metabolite transporter (DMT)-like permease